MTIYNLADLWERFVAYPDRLLIYDCKKKETFQACTVDSMNKMIEKHNDCNVCDFSMLKYDKELELYVEIK